MEIWDCKNVLVRFDERSFEKITTSNYAKSGAVRLPKHFVGDIHQDKFGNTVVISKIGNDKVTLVWGDGYEREFQQSVLVTKSIMRESESRRLNPTVQVGKKFITNQDCLIEVKEIKSNGKCIVEFQEPHIFSKEVYKSNVVSGNVHNQYLPTVAGFGVIGDFPVNCSSKMYRSWSGMIKRVYTPKQNQIITYGDCRVCAEWKYIGNFDSWFSKQVICDDWELDKDLLVKGNREYCPEKCIFLPREINSFLTDRRNHRGDFPIGVTFRKTVGNFEACCSVDGKRKYLGVYSTPEEAFIAYKQTKESLAKSLAEKWRGKIDQRAVQALESYIVTIDD